MLTTKPPWAEFEPIVALYKIPNADFPQFSLSDNASAIVHDFLRQVFKQNYVERPTAEQLILHPFVNINISM